MRRSTKNELPNRERSEGGKKGDEVHPLFQKGGANEKGKAA